MVRAVLLLVLFAAVPARAASSANADRDSTGPPPTSLVRALDRIQPAARVRVEASTHGLLEGTLEHWDVHSLRLLEPTVEGEIPAGSRCRSRRGVSQVESALPMTNVFRPRDPWMP